jgi:Uma2 family endonuclease
MVRAHPKPVAQTGPVRMSYDEWREWYGADEGRRGEWVDGEVVPFMPPLAVHALIIGFLARLIGNYSDLHDLGEVVTDQLELWLPESQAARLPDICFLSREHADRLTTHRLEGYADLVVEVISPDSVTRDRRQKFDEYQRAGIPEYWIVDPRPRRRSVTLYALDANGEYQALPADQAGRLHSRVLAGFWLDPAWLWREPMPKPYHLVSQIMAG